MQRIRANEGWWCAAARWLSALCLLLTAGCQSSFGPSFTPPEVSVEGFDLSRAGLFSQVLTITLLVENRMTQAMTIEAVDLDLEVNGNRLGSGTTLKSIPLDAERTVVVNVPVKVKTQDILDVVLAMASRPSLDYEISGHVRVRGGEDGGSETVRFNDDGAFDLPLAPSRFQSIAADDLQIR